MMRVKKNQVRLRKMAHTPTLVDRKRMLVEAINACNEPATIAALETTLIECAARFLADDNS